MQEPHFFLLRQPGSLGDWRGRGGGRKAKSSTHPSTAHLTPPMEKSAPGRWLVWPARLLCCLARGGHWSWCSLILPVLFAAGLLHRKAAEDWNEAIYTISAGWVCPDTLMFMFILIVHGRRVCRNFGPWGIPCCSDLQAGCSANKSQSASKKRL